jgi:hypothetical protein
MIELLRKKLLIPRPRLVNRIKARSAEEVYWREWTAMHFLGHLGTSFHGRTGPLWMATHELTWYGQR